MVRLSPQGARTERWNRLNPEAKSPAKPYVTALLEGRQGPAIAALTADGKVTAKDVSRAIKEYRIDVEKPNPIGV